ASRAIDGQRLADVLARGVSSAGRRMKLGAQWRIERAGSAAPTARRSVEEAYGAADLEALLEASIAKRLRGRTEIVDEKEFQRLYRYLIRHGFEPARAIRPLKAHSIKRVNDVERDPLVVSQIFRH